MNRWLKITLGISVPVFLLCLLFTVVAPADAYDKCGLDQVFQAVAGLHVLAFAVVALGKKSKKLNSPN